MVRREIGKHQDNRDHETRERDHPLSNYSFNFKSPVFDRKKRDQERIENDVGADKRRTRNEEPEKEQGTRTGIEIVFCDTPYPRESRKHVSKRNVVGPEIGAERNERKKEERTNKARFRIVDPREDKIDDIRGKRLYDKRPDLYRQIHIVVSEKPRHPVKLKVSERRVAAPEIAVEDPARKHRLRGVDIVIQVDPPDARSEKIRQLKHKS